MEKECEKCVKRKTMMCPNSELCYSTKDKPYFLLKKTIKKVKGRYNDTSK
jgi:hypothetical protein